MAAKKGKKIKVQDLKPKKDAKGGIVFNAPGHNAPGHNKPGYNKPLGPLTAGH
jgi:hypothetical protein